MHKNLNVPYRYLWLNVKDDCGIKSQYMHVGTHKCLYVCEEFYVFACMYVRDELLFPP